MVDIFYKTILGVFFLSVGIFLPFLHHLLLLQRDYTTGSKSLSILKKHVFPIHILKPHLPCPCPKFFCANQHYLIARWYVFISVFNFYLLVLLRITCCILEQERGWKWLTLGYAYITSDHFHLTSWKNRIYLRYSIEIPLCLIILNQRNKITSINHIMQYITNFIWTIKIKIVAQGSI